MDGELRTSITPGRPWLDTKGERIQAHGGSLMHLDGTFYWYGENKEKTVGNGDIWHWGIRLYASRDLYNWEDRGLIIPPTPHDPDSPLHPARQVDRPHIVHDRRTGRFICWIKIMGPVYETAVLVADSIDGPYTLVRSGMQPLGMSAGDFDLVVDPADGKGYYYFERVHSELICADLTPDYTDVTGYYSTHFPHPHPPQVREAPAYFRRGSKHYLITSGTTGYFPNPSEAAIADTYHGPWTPLGNPHIDDPTGTSHRSQIAAVFRHPAKRDLYIALADRWLPDLPAETSTRVIEGMTAMAQAGTNLDEAARAEAHAAFATPNTSVADYVWLPIEFEGERPIIRWRDTWRIEDFD